MCAPAPEEESKEDGEEVCEESCEATCEASSEEHWEEDSPFSTSSDVRRYDDTFAQWCRHNEVTV